MTTYKLTYFNITGLGEPIRFILSYGGIKFEDCRISFEEWPSMKSKMPLGQMPVLEIDGKQYNQSKAIMRFLGKKFNLYGSDDSEAWQIDAAADSIDDLRQALSNYHWEENATQKEKMKDGAFKKLAYSLEKFEEQVKKNGGYFVNGKASWADIFYAGICEYLANILGYNVNKDHAELKKLVDKIAATPNVKAYLDKRPKTSL